MTHIKDTQEWSKRTFGSCDLGDKRRVSRLVNYATAQACNPDGSTNKVCEGSDAAAEGAYRFLRNDVVDPAAIDDGAFRFCATQCEGRRTVLAIQDTSSVEISHKPLRKIVAKNGCPTGFLVHSTIMVDADTSEVIGIIDQERWLRGLESNLEPIEDERTYEEKESFKWEAADERINFLLKDPKAVITICDREADIFEYIRSKIDHDERFLIRASVNRKTALDNSLWKEMEGFKTLGHKTITISQRGESQQDRKETRPARTAREAILEIRAGSTLIVPPKRIQSDGSLISVNAIYVVEINPKKDCEPLEWRLLTTEPVDTLEQALKIVGYYEKRWLIEEFHKCWKTGCRAEDRPFQSFDVVERFLAISCHIAIRILQLHSLAHLFPEESCASILTEEERECLSATSPQPTKGKTKKTEQSNENPSNASPDPDLPRPMTAQDALLRIAKLAGWRDTKRTGRIGWQTLWEGWSIFQERLLGWRVAKQYFNSKAKIAQTIELEM